MDTRKQRENELFEASAKSKDKNAFYFCSFLIKDELILEKMYYIADSAMVRHNIIDRVKQPDILERMLEQTKNKHQCCMIVEKINDRERLERIKNSSQSEFARSYAEDKLATIDN